MAIISTAKIVGMLASAKKTGRQVMNAAGEWVAEVVERLHVRIRRLWVENLGVCERKMDA